MSLSELQFRKRGIVCSRKVYDKDKGENDMDNLTVEQALEALLTHSKIIEETEVVSILQARGKVLAEDMTAELDNPPFDKSPIDGYACKAEQG